MKFKFNKKSLAYTTIYSSMAVGCIVIIMFFISRFNNNTILETGFGIKETHQLLEFDDGSLAKKVVEDTQVRIVDNSGNIISMNLGMNPEIKLSDENKLVISENEQQIRDNCIIYTRVKHKTILKYTLYVTDAKKIEQ